MFKFLTLFARPAPGRTSTTAADALRYHAPLYCAARNVYLTAETVFTAVDADRLYCALSELQRLATELGSPSHDLADIAEWSHALGVRAQQLRLQPVHAPLSPEAAPVDVFISRGIVARERPQQRRASA